MVEEVPFNELQSGLDAALRGFFIWIEGYVLADCDEA